MCTCHYEVLKVWLWLCIWCACVCVCAWAFLCAWSKPGGWGVMEGWRIKAGLRGNKASVGFKQNRPHKTHSAYARQSRRPRGRDLGGASHKGETRDSLATTLPSLSSSWKPYKGGKWESGRKQERDKKDSERAGLRGIERRQKRAWAWSQTGRGKGEGEEGRGVKQKERDRGRQRKLGERAWVLLPAFNTVFQVGRGSFRRVQSPSSAPVFWVVVHKHVVGDGQDVTLHAHRGGHNHLGQGRTERNDNKLHFDLSICQFDMVCLCSWWIPVKSWMWIIDLYFEANMQIL